MNVKRQNRLLGLGNELHTRLMLTIVDFTFSSVFLGFTKNGQFVLSYTLNVEADEHTAYPIYAYRLQWWHFVPYKKLRKVSTSSVNTILRLYIQAWAIYDLVIAVALIPNCGLWGTMLYVMLLPHKRVSCNYVIPVS